MIFAMSALEIMKKSQDRDTGDNIIGTMQMQLIGSNGSKRVKEMKTFSKNKGKDTLKVSFFTSPSDVKNTSFLTYDYTDKDDEQWMYLPALAKIKRIPSSDKSSSFMGSDFSYSDMTTTNLDDYNFKLLKTSTIKRKVNGKKVKRKVWVIQRTPKTSKIVDETGYKKSVIYVRQDNFMPVRAKIYLQEQNKFKYMDVKKVEKISGIDVATIMTMTSKTGKHTTHKTVIFFKNVKMNQKIKNSLFTTRAIAKGI
jgi:hypothetical protein